MCIPRHVQARTRTLGVCLASVMLLSLLVAAPAGAAPTCTFDVLTATATVEVGNGETATIARSGDAITLDGAPCDVATVATTDAIVVNGTGIPTAVVLDLSGGPFAPGLTPETDGGDSEIEFTINLPAGSPLVQVTGSGGTDTIVAGAAGLNLNAEEAAGDADVLIVGLPNVVVDGGAGNDVLSVAGGSGTGAPSTASLHGGTEADRLIGTTGGNAFDGGDGSDTVDYTAATEISADLPTGLVQHVGGQLDTLANVENLVGSPGADTLVGDDDLNILRGGEGPDTLSGGGGPDTLDGGAGIDTASFADAPGPVSVSRPAGVALGDGDDALAEIENVIGSSFPDQLIGDGGANHLNGGDGNDRIEGGGGDDTLDGGPGSDTAEFTLADEPVSVNLGKETAKGAGDDSLISFENVRGSPQADTINGTGGANVLEGGHGADTINGRSGRDQVVGGAGRDRLFGQKGDDEVQGGTGNDQLNGGKGSNDFCRGGPGADSFVFCEKIRID